MKRNICKIGAAALLIGIILLSSVGVQAASTLKFTVAENNIKDDGLRQALTVGVNLNLKYCDDDARNFYRVLTDNGWNCDIHTDAPQNSEENPDVSLNTIKNKLITIGTQTNDDSVSFFSFSGHGVYDNELGEAGICLSDGFLWASDLSKILDCFKGRIVCVFDSCHAGGLDETKTLNIESQFNTDEFVTDFLTTVGGGNENRVLLLACTADESSIEIGQLGAGLWAYFVHEGLNGNADSNHDGIITAEETFYYARPRAIDYYKDYKNKFFSSIHPQIYDGDHSSEVPIIIGSVNSNPAPTSTPIPIPLLTTTATSTSNLKLARFLPT